MRALPAQPVEEDDEGTTVWELRRDGVVIGSARTLERVRGRRRLTDLDVPADEASAGLEALGVSLRDQGVTVFGVDVPAGDGTLSAAVADAGGRLVATQMRLDLTEPVQPPARVTLRSMTAEEFGDYREHLVAAYAQEMFDAGSFDDLASALTASESSTQELLPDGLASPGHHLWFAHDGGTAVGILWIHAEGERAYIYDIEVWAGQRRRGYGREILDAGAVAAQGLGATALALNVFGHNAGARALYLGAGYEITEQTYRISL